MKTAICLLVLLPLVMSLSVVPDDKRFVLDTLGLDDYTVDDVVDFLKEQLGSDTTEAACELACPVILSSVNLGLLNFYCDDACLKLQDYFQSLK